MNGGMIFVTTVVASTSLAMAAVEPASNDAIRTRPVVYKRIGDVALKLHLYLPASTATTDKRPAVIFFFGGGWQTGSPSQFDAHCRHLASRGMVAAAADYRVYSRHKTRAVKCVEDGKSAVRWLRSHADELGVDPHRIAAGGGSAGGHVAAATAIIPGFEAENEDRSVSSRPDALILFNPALVLAPVDGHPPFPERRMKTLRTRLGTEPVNLSPYHHVRQGLPPTIVFHGTADKVVPFGTAEAFARAMKQHGNRCELKRYPGKGHGFFNYRRDRATYDQTVKEMDAFLTSIGFLPAGT